MTRIVLPALVVVCCWLGGPGQARADHNSGPYSFCLTPIGTGFVAAATGLVAAPAIAIADDSISAGETSPCIVKILKFTALWRNNPHQLFANVAGVLPS